MFAPLFVGLDKGQVQAFNPAGSDSNQDEKQLEQLQEDLENHKSKLQAKEQGMENMKMRLEQKDTELASLRA